MYQYFMNFYPLYEGLNHYFLTERCNHGRLKKHFARPWGNEGFVYYLYTIVPHERLALNEGFNPLQYYYRFFSAVTFLAARHDHAEKW